jgi:uncharacterized Tic20 family protein
MSQFRTEYEERNWAMFCHLGGLGHFIPFGNIILPLILWSMRKDESELVNREGKKALNFQISFTIYMIISGILVFVFVGVLFLVILGLLNLIFVILAVVKTLNSEEFEYPMTIKFIQ